MTTVRDPRDLVPGTCVRILAAALLASGCSSANLEPPPTHTVVTPPEEAGAPVYIFGFLDIEEPEKR